MCNGRGSLDFTCIIFPSKLNVGDWVSMSPATSRHWEHRLRWKPGNISWPYLFPMHPFTISAVKWIYHLWNQALFWDGTLGSTHNVPVSSWSQRTNDIYRVSYMTFILLLSPPLKEIFQMTSRWAFVAKKWEMVVDVYPCLEAVWSYQRTWFSWGQM